MALLLYVMSSPSSPWGLGPFMTQAVFRDLYLDHGGV